MVIGIGNAHRDSERRFYRIFIKNTLFSYIPTSSIGSRLFTRRPFRDRIAIVRVSRDTGIFDKPVDIVKAQRQRNQRFSARKRANSSRTIVFRNLLSSSYRGGVPASGFYLHSNTVPRKLFLVGDNGRSNRRSRFVLPTINTTIRIRWAVSLDMFQD